MPCPFLKSSLNSPTYIPPSFHKYVPSPFFLSSLYWPIYFEPSFRLNTPKPFLASPINYPSYFPSMYIFFRIDICVVVCSKEVIFVGRAWTVINFYSMESKEKDEESFWMSVLTRSFLICTFSRLICGCKFLIRFNIRETYFWLASALSSTFSCLSCYSFSSLFRVVSKIMFFIFCFPHN